MAARTDGYLPLRDYALLGDCHGAALVGVDGSVDWFCSGRFDAQPVCWSLLDAHRGARFCIAPCGAFDSKRAYLPLTNVLSTSFHHAEGVLTVTDFLPVQSADDAAQPSVDLDAPGWLVRVVEARDGDCEIALAYHPGDGVFDPDIEHTPDMRLFQQGGAPVEQLETTLTLKAGERRVFVLAPYEDADQAPAEQGAALLEETTAFWREWSEASRYRGPYREAVARSALALKALTYAPTGAIVAAPTTSLPENIGGERNWDYRYSWLRDSSFVLQALGGLGYDAEAGRYCEYLGSTCVNDLRILYGIASESIIEERELPHLEGYRGSRPVRVGNAASDQLQLDIYGEVADWALAYRALGGPIDDALQAMLEEIADQAMCLWTEPDQGIWEMRGTPRHFVHGKAMAWVALDRAIQLLGPRDEWCAARDDILATLQDHAGDDQGGGLQQTLSDGGMDAALLLLPMIDLPLSDRVLDQTVRGVERALRAGDYVLRYSLENTDDGLQGSEGAFLICSFWLVDALLCMRREQEARDLFARLLAHANDVGLYAEEIDPQDQAFLGNFPQAFTHLALINSAINLELYEKEGPGALRGTHADRVERATSQAQSGGENDPQKQGEQP
ncbi:glycoside hydrolase family 15 protein [Sulfitobacter sp. PS-8MA]|uniref:glycoside hydrolase family 15 protein n=1 Tax=Sulfitobacter sp. PS-8MA TaxID=3237707 RepID=UPI0034C5D053